MREQVAIVLNEREPLKAKISETLLSKLAEQSITASRFDIDEHIEQQLLELKPQVLVLDYVLGDYSTGLDVAQSFRNSDENLDTQFLFLTDEPSIEVAVEAMRLGAKHYLDIDDPASVNLLLQEIQDIILKQPTRRRPVPHKSLTLNDLTANSPSSRTMVEQAKVLAAKHEPIVMVSGPTGSGKRTVARALLESYRPTGLTHEVEFPYFTGTANELTQLNGLNGQSYLLGTDLSVLVYGIEADDGELLEHITQLKSTAWPGEVSASNRSFLICTTDSSETVEAWQRLTGAEVLSIPELNEGRSDDFPSLCQAFVLEAKQLIGSKAKPLEGDTVQWLSQQTWPGNIRQLRSVVIDAVISSTSTNRTIQELLEERKELSRYGANGFDSSGELDPLLVARALEMNNYRYRATAAKLGCSVPALRGALENIS